MQIIFPGLTVDKLVSACILVNAYTTYPCLILVIQVTFPCHCKMSVFRTDLQHSHGILPWWF